MRYSDEIIEEVRERTDIVDLISGYVKLQRKGSSYFGLCPFHHEKTGSFSVSPARQMYYCFGCGAGGNAYTFLMQYENATFQEAVRMLADRSGFQLPEPDDSKEAKARADRKATLLQIQKTAAEYYVEKLSRKQGERALAYLHGRGLSDLIIRRFGLGYADKYSNDLYRHLKEKGYADDLLKETGLFHYDEKHGFSDKFWNRVIFPIMDANSRVIGFGGRVMGEGKPKYLNSPETVIFDKSRNLYGLHQARRTREKDMLLCEGYMDVISMHQAGFTNAVASLGTALTEQQCHLLSRFVKSVLMLYDMDDAGIRAARRGIPLLREAGLSAKVVDLSPHKDPDEFLQSEGRDAFVHRLELAENGFLFLVRMEEKEYDLQDPGGKSAFLHRVADMILTIPDEIERNSYLEACAAKYRVDTAMLRKEVGKQSLRGTGKRVIEAPRQARTMRKEQNAHHGDKGQKMMLTWLSSTPGLLEKTAKILGPEDFINPLCREVAELLWEQKAKGDIHPASILDHFPEEEEQAEVAAMFHTEIPFAKPDEQKAAFFEVLCRMKRDSLEHYAAAQNNSDMEQLMRMTDERKKLEKMQRDGPPSWLDQIEFNSQ